jgi:hypothetical protein
MILLIITLGSFSTTDMVNWQQNLCKKEEMWATVLNWTEEELVCSALLQWIERAKE